MNVYGLLVNPAFFRRKTKGFNPCFCVGCKFQHNLTGLTPEGAQPQLQELSWQGLMDVWMSTSISAGEACKACSIWPSTCSLVPTNGYKWHPLQKSWTPLVSLHWWWNPDMDGEFQHLTTSQKTGVRTGVITYFRSGTDTPPMSLAWSSPTPRRPIRGSAPARPELQHGLGMAFFLPEVVSKFWISQTTSALRIAFVNRHD